MPTRPLGEYGGDGTETQCWSWLLHGNVAVISLEALPYYECDGLHQDISAEEGGVR